MAQLKDSVVQGSLRVTDTTYTTNLIISNTTAPTIATSDYLIIADASDGNKILKGPELNTSNTTKWLTQAGTWTTPTAANVGASASNHVHGNLTNDGKITATATIANGDKIVIVDSDSTAASKITGSSITFDGSTATQALTKKGTWETFNNYSHPTGDGNLHVPATGTGNNGKFLKAGSTAGSLSWANAVTSITIKTTSPITGGNDTATTTTGTYTIGHATGDGNLHVPETSTTNNGKFLKAGSTAGSLSWDTAVTSVQVQATSPLTSSTNTAQTSTLNTTIAFSNQNANLILAGPSSGNAAAPAFRSLVAADLPIATISAIGGVSASTGLSVTAAGALSVSYGTTASTALQGNQVLFNLNGTDKTASDAAAFYAPTAVGTSGQFLKSSGSGAPAWGSIATSDLPSGVALVKLVSIGWSSGTSFTYPTSGTESWITADTAIVATDLQMQTLPGIVSWTIAAGKVTFSCTASVSNLNFKILLLKWT